MAISIKQYDKAWIVHIESEAWVLPFDKSMEIAKRYFDAGYNVSLHLNYYAYSLPEDRVVMKLDGLSKFQSFIAIQEFIDNLLNEKSQFGNLNDYTIKKSRCCYDNS